MRRFDDCYDAFFPDLEAMRIGSWNFHGVLTSEQSVTFKVSPLKRFLPKNLPIH